MSFNIPSKNEPIQYHWVVSYDCETAEFTLDYETTSAVFGNGPVFDKSTDEWRPLHASEWEKDGTLYNVAGDALFNRLENDLNKRFF